MYGYQWVKWEKFTENPESGEIKKTYINQIKDVIELIKNNPDSRRMIVTAVTIILLESGLFLINSITSFI